MKKKCTNKSGVSAIVATVLIVMLTILAVGIIWVAVLPQVQNILGAGDICSKVDIAIDSSSGYTCYIPENITLIQVDKRNVNVNISGLRFYLSSTGNAIKYTKSLSFFPVGSQVFYLNSSDIFQLDKIEVSPIVRLGSIEKECPSVYLEPVVVCSSALLGSEEISRIIAHEGSGGLINPGENDPNIYPSFFTTFPSINISSLVNNSIYTTSLIWFNFSSDQVVDWKYSLNGGANISFVPNISLNLDNWNYNVTVYVNNSNGTSSTFLNFSVNAPCATQTLQGFYNGTGTLASPYGICNCTMLQNMKNYLTANFSLLSDIDCSMTSGVGFVPIGSFLGKLEGNNYKIISLHINSAGSDPVGLFGALLGSVYNVGLVDVDVTGKNIVGTLAGSLSGTINNSYSTGVVMGNNTVSVNTIGGLVGRSNGIINNSYSNVSVSVTYSGGASASSIGGLIGEQYGGVVSGSYSTGNVTGTSYVGGLIGYQNYGNVSKCYSVGMVLGYGGSTNLFGGLIGYSTGIINNSYSLSSVDGQWGDPSNAGGLIGEQHGGIVSNSYATGNVNGTSNVGGLIGYVYYASKGVTSTVSNSYATGNVTGSSNAGGLLGSFGGGTLSNSYWYNRSQGLNCWTNVTGGFNINCTAKTDVTYFYNYDNAPMNFSEGNIWDFNNVWSNFGNGMTYPVLK